MKKDTLPALKKERAENVATIERDNRDRNSLVKNKDKGSANRFQALSAAIERVRQSVDQATRKQQSLLALKDEVANVRDNTASRWLRRRMEEHAVAGLTAEQWEAFQLDFKGDVNTLLSTEISKVKTLIKKLKGPAGSEPDLDVEPATSTPLIEDAANFTGQTLSLLTKELQRVQALIGVDQANARHLEQISQNIAKGEAQIAKIDGAIDAATQADKKITDLAATRETAYRDIFQAILDEQQSLEELYRPLEQNLLSQTGALGQLSFSARRKVDVEAWASAGEELLDLRKAGPFRGTGALYEAAVTVLVLAWASGKAEDVATAMYKFRSEYEVGINRHRPELLKIEKLIVNGQAKLALGSIALTTSF